MAIDEGFLKKLSASKGKVRWHKEYKPLQKREQRINRELRKLEVEETNLEGLRESFHVFKGDLEEFLKDVKKVSLELYEEIIARLNKLYEKLSSEREKPVEAIKSEAVDEQRRLIDSVIEEKIKDTHEKKAQLQERKAEIIEEVQQLLDEYKKLDEKEKRLPAYIYVEKIRDSFRKLAHHTHLEKIPEWILMIGLISITLIVIAWAFYSFYSTTSNYQGGIPHTTSLRTQVATTSSTTTQLVTSSIRIPTTTKSKIISGLPEERMITVLEVQEIMGEDWKLTNTQSHPNVYNAWYGKSPIQTIWLKLEIHDSVYDAKQVYRSSYNNNKNFCSHTGCIFDDKFRIGEEGYRVFRNYSDERKRISSYIRVHNSLFLVSVPDYIPDIERKSIQISKKQIEKIQAPE